MKNMVRKQKGLETFMYKSLYLFTMFIWILSSCRQFANDETGKIEAENCMPPVVGSSFPVNDNFEVAARAMVLPKLPWQPDSSLPNLSDNLKQSDILFVRQPAVGSTEIWTRSYLSMMDRQVAIGRNIAPILVYHTSEHSWEQISINEVSPADIQAIDRLYLATDGGVFAASFSSSDIVLSRFDERQREFKALMVPQKIPYGSTIFDQARNIFWIIVPHEAIYSFDPVSIELVKHVEIPNVQVSFENGVAVASDGSVYILNDGGKDVRQKDDLEILRFVPNKNIIELVYNPLIDQTPFFSLFIDKSDNLWLDDHAWKSPSNIWYQVVRSPLFITDRMPDSGHHYFWTFPRIVFESSDGMLWFQSTNGTVSYDPQRGGWCWFTTFKSNIVEDSHHNLWMIADGTLYKNTLAK